MFLVVRQLFQSCSFVSAQSYIPDTEREYGVSYHERVNGVTAGAVPANSFLRCVDAERPASARYEEFEMNHHTKKLFAALLLTAVAGMGAAHAQDAMKTEPMAGDAMSSDKMAPMGGDAAMKECLDRAKAEADAMKRDEMAAECGKMGGDAMEGDAMKGAPMEGGSMGTDSMSPDSENKM